MRYMICVCLLILSLYTSAKDYGTFVGFNIGRTQIDLNQNFEGVSDSIVSPNAGLSIGYLFKSKVVTQLGISASENSSFFGTFDRFSLTHLDALVGYQFQREKLRFTPKIGYASWSLNSKEGRFFNPGSEDTKEDSGTDIFLAASFGYALSKRFELSLTHKNINTDFGGYSLTHFDFILSF